MIKYIYQKLNLENIFHKSTKEPNYLKDVIMQDEITGQTFNVVDLILDLNRRIEKLEHENIENSNLIYELMHSLDALDVRIDIVTAEKFLKENNV